MFPFFLEIEFADKCKKPLVPIRIEKKFRTGEDWLGFLLGTIFWYDLSNEETYEKQFANFLEAISVIGHKAMKVKRKKSKCATLVFKVFLRHTMNELFCSSWSELVI